MKKIFIIGLTLSFMFSSFTACTVSEKQQKMTPSEQNSRVSDSSSAPEDTVIDEGKAKQIAIEKAGISPDGISFEKIEMDNDDGVWHYEIVFTSGRVKYSADIKADDGYVLSFESEIVD